MYVCMCTGIVVSWSQKVEMQIREVKKRLKNVICKCQKCRFFYFVQFLLNDLYVPGPKLDTRNIEVKR